MRVLVIEKNADGALDIAMRLKALGHDVRYCLGGYDQHKNPVGRGLVERVPDWRSSVRWADLTVIGANDWCQAELDGWRKSGARIVGSSVEAASWEHDRARGMAVFKKAGIPVAPFRSFTDYDSAIAYVKREDRPFASKPSGKCDDKALSYVAKTPEDLVYMLNRWKRAGKRQGLEFILQEKLDGIEFAVGAWFGPGGFVDGIELNWEHKKLMAGNLGVNCGEMGTVMVYMKADKLAKTVLYPLEDQLQRAGFIGNVDINCIVDESGNPWPLEFTTRGGWPALNIEMDLFDTDPAEFWLGLANGKPPKGAHKLDEIAVGIVLAHGDFPHSHITRREVIGVPIRDVGPQEKGIHYAQAMLEDGEMRTAGDYVLIAVGLGDTVQKARGSAYRAVKKPRLPTEQFYRPDIGARLARQLPELQAHGYATGIAFS